MQTPTYTAIQARDKLHALIRGWAMYHASEQHLADLRAIEACLNRIIDPDTRMGELRTMDAPEYSAS